MRLARAKERTGNQYEEGWLSVDDDPVCRSIPKALSGGFPEGDSFGRYLKSFRAALKQTMKWFHILNRVVGKPK
jgi:hypothetical protein